MTDEERSPIREGVTASSSDSSHQSSSRPSPRQRKLNEFMKPGWLRAHKKTNASSLPQNPEFISISDSRDSSPRPIQLADDLGSVCPVGDKIDDVEKLNNLFTYLDQDQAGPSRLGRGRGKDINLFPGIRDCLNDPETEDERQEDQEGEDEILSVSPLNYAMEMPSPPDNPYRDPLLEQEVDLEFGSDFEENEKADLRKSQKILSCAGLASEISSEEIMWMIEYYNLAGRWLKPRPQMRMHYFPDTRLPTPRMVLTNKLVELGFGSPIHPFLLEITNFYNIAPIQLSPNSYRMIIGLYIMYRKKGFPPPTMTEISHFVGIRRSGNDLGFFYVALYPSHNRKGFSVGNPSNMKLWKPDYFYLFDVPRVRTQFNIDPRK